MISTTSLRRARATAGARARVAAVVAILAIGWWSTAPAQAAVSPFVLSPSSGPPGTLVSVSGTGCSPGLTRSPSDFVAVAAPTFGLSMQPPVAEDGSWHETFIVPSDAGTGDAPVAAVCVTDGLPSLTTQYTAQMFTVTAAPPTTTTSPPTTSPTTGGTTPGGTTPKPGPGGSTPTTQGGPPDTGGGSGPSPTVPTSEGVPSGDSNGGAAGGGSGSNSGTSARPVKADAAPRHSAAAARAADLRAPELAAAQIGDTSELDWVAWTLLIALVVGAVAAPLLLRRWRRRDTDTPATGDVA